MSPELTGDMNVTGRNSRPIQLLRTGIILSSIFLSSVQFSDVNWILRNVSPKCTICSKMHERSNAMTRRSAVIERDSAALCGISHCNRIRTRMHNYATKLSLSHGTEQKINKID